MRGELTVLEITPNDPELKTNIRPRIFDFRMIEVEEHRRETPDATAREW